MSEIVTKTSIKQNLPQKNIANVDLLYIIANLYDRISQFITEIVSKINRDKIELQKGFINR
jgi:hypothetical protein